MSQRLRPCWTSKESNLSWVSKASKTPGVWGWNAALGGHYRPSETISTKWWCQSQLVGLKKKWLIKKRTKKLRIIERNKYKFKREADLRNSVDCVLRIRETKAPFLNLEDRKSTLKIEIRGHTRRNKHGSNLVLFIKNKKLNINMYQREFGVLKE